MHDDLLVSTAMCYVLDGQMWGLAESEVMLVSFAPKTGDLKPRSEAQPAEGMGRVF